MHISTLRQHTLQALRQRIHQASDPRPLWQRRLSCTSDFCRALVACGYMSPEQMRQAATAYRLGRSSDGGVIFWQIDERDTLHDGKIMHYRSDAHRDHQRHPSWVTYALRRAGLLPPDYQAAHCLFGLHLLPTTAAATVCVVESEKTAVIMSALRPTCLWLATGGKTELSVARLAPLQGRRVMLFPDTDPDGQTYAQWYEVAEAAAPVLGHPVSVSTLLERHATPAQKADKIDIADLLLPLNSH